MRTPKYDIGQRVERLTNSDTSAPMGSIATIQLVSIAEDYIMYYFKEGGFSLENDLAEPIETDKVSMILEKGIPMKPTYLNGVQHGTFCGRCSSDFAEFDLYIDETPYCPVCGQRIDWRD